MSNLEMKNENKEESFPYLVWLDLVSACLHPATYAICLRPDKYMNGE